MRILIAFMVSLLPLFAIAEDKAEPVKFEEGKHYTVLSGQPEPAKTGPIDVTELFWYGCGHCYAFEPIIGPWKKTLADDVNFTRSPAMWRMRRDPPDAMWTHAKLYYTASALGELEKLHPVFFEAMHKKNKRLVSKDEIAALVTAQGLDGKAFVETMDSFAVNAQVNLADKRQKDYKVSGTPEMVVGGYYHVTTSKAGSQQKMLEIVDYLVDKIRKERM